MKGILKTQFEKEAKKAFSLIELIISIIIIGIASMTLPLMLSSANKLEEQTLNQDVFFKSIAVMTDILSRSWDKVPETNKTVSGSPGEISTGDVNETLIWYITNTNSDQNLTKKIGLFRYGSVQEYTNRRFYSSEDLQDANASDIETTSGEIVAGSTNFKYINQYNNKYIRETLDGANVDFNISVRYVDDKVSTDATGKRQKAVWSLSSGGAIAEADSTNLKRINIKATKNFGGEPMEVEFVYFSSNIGTPEVKTK